MRYYSIHHNSGETNDGIGQIRAAYVVNNNSVLTFHDSEGTEVCWYVLLRVK
jgi:translation initiation factor 6 (eIF-6)